MLQYGRTALIFAVLDDLTAVVVLLFVGGKVNANEEQGGAPSRCYRAMGC